MTVPTLGNWPYEGLRNCLAAVLPNNALIVCGGYTPNGLTATVEVASLYQTAHSKILLPHATTK